MFTRRKNSVEHLPGVDGAQLRSHPQHRQRMPSPRRSSFHGSESQIDHQLAYETFEERKRKYATAPITNHDHAGRKARGDKPPTLPKGKNLPQAPYQKTFIAMLRNRDGRSNKRRSQEIIEAFAPVTPPATSAKPASGVFYQPLPEGPSVAAAQPAVKHAADQQYVLQYFNAEPLQQQPIEFTHLCYPHHYHCHQHL